MSSFDIQRKKAYNRVAATLCCCLPYLPRLAFAHRPQVAIEFRLETLGAGLLSLAC
jgi:hypothetical protein